MIRCLPTEVQGRLRSGVAIPSLQQCVEELLLNSIDAGATCVGVRMDMEAFKVQVIDNGCGMTAEDMERVGSRYHTSKCSCVKDLENLRSFGFRGEALASIVSLATLVEVTSRTRLSVKTHVKLFKDGHGMDVFEAETARPSAGTTVIVCNFFHNMPVRRKRMDAVMEGERIRQRVEALSLMRPSVSFTLKNDYTGAMMVQLPKARDTHHRFVQIHGLARAEKLGEVSHAHKQFDVTGYLGKEGHYNSSLQYLYVNDRLLLKTRIHKLLNCLLRRLSSSNQKQDSPDGTPVIRSPKHKRNQDQYGVYIINIKCPYSEYDICLEPAKTLVEFKDWDGVLLCVEEAVKAFLRRENLVSLFCQEDLDCVSPKVFSAERTDQEKETQGAVGASTLDCSVGMKLASDFVHRRRAADLIESRADKSPRHEQIGVNEFEKKAECDLEPASSDADDRVQQAFDEAADKLGRASGEDWALSKGEVSDSHLPISQIPTCQLDSSSNQQIFQHHGRKIRLSDPYVHQSLQVQYRPDSNKPVLQVPDLALRFIAPKPKILHNSNQDGASLKPCKDAAAVIPSKIPRFNPPEKLSTSNQPGSLDEFRQTYTTSLKANIQRSRLQNATRISQTLSFSKSPDSLSASEDGDEEGAPTTLATNYGSGQVSLAAKLCRLKRHTTEDIEDSQHACGDLSEDKNCLRVSTDATQDSTNSLNPQNHKATVEPSLESSRKRQLVGDEGESTCSDWLHHYDTAVGKTVYINKKTGLSRYEEPVSGEAQVSCTSDVSNMAVSVTSEMDDADESSNSLSSLYSKWKNPVFVRPPTVGVDISSGRADGLAVKIHNILFPYRFSKNMMHSMKVVNQVDKKFLACLINARDGDSASQTETEGNLLVLVDQHAAHERVRLENLVADSYEGDPDASGEKRLCSSTILPPLEISVTEEELRLLSSTAYYETPGEVEISLTACSGGGTTTMPQNMDDALSSSCTLGAPTTPIIWIHADCKWTQTSPETLQVARNLSGSSQPHLKNLGLEVTFSKMGAPQVFVGKVPLCFMEKESNELRRGRPSVIKPIVEEYLREQTELLRLTGRVGGTLPLTVLKVLASLACHGAIKFNDTLSRDECHSLVASLSSCQLPFQCAHGRPSIVPLVDLLHLDKEHKDFQKPNLQKLRRMYKAWELYGNK